MIYILVAIVVVAVLSTLLLKWGFDHVERSASIYGVTFGFVGSVASLFLAIWYACQGWNYLGAGYQADIINREYGTHYTQAEVFYASDVIDTIRQLQRKRIELNGDLMRGEKP